MNFLFAKHRLLDSYPQDPWQSSHTSPSRYFVDRPDSEVVAHPTEGRFSEATMYMTVIPAFLLCLSGCPESPDNLPDGSPAVQAEMPPGEASAQPPGVGGEVPDLQTTRFDVDPEDGLTVSGSISYSGEKTGTVLLQVLTIAANQPPSLMHHEELEGPGEFSLTAPKNLGPARLISFLDVDDGGPSTTDPAAMLSVEISTKDLTNLALVLEDEPDLGDMTPGADHSDAMSPPTPTATEATPE